MKKSAALGLGVVISLALLATVEAGLRLNQAYGWIDYPPRRATRLGYRPSAENWDGVDKKILKSFPDKFQNLRNVYGQRLYSEQTMAEFTSTDLSGKYRFVKRAPGGEIVYDIQYRYNDKQRRPTPGQPKNATLSVLVVGCSYALGEGVEEDETIAAFMQAKLKGVAVETLAFHGWGIGNHLSALRNESFPANRPNPYRKLEKNPVIVVYVFIPDHIIRSTCPLSCYRRGNQWMQALPNYETSVPGRVKLLGSFADSRPLSFLYRFVANSAIWQQWGSPFDQEEDSMRKYFNILNAYRQQLEEKVTIKDFYFVPIEQFYPFDDRVSEMARENNFKVLDLGKVDLSKMIGRNPRIPFDGHYSAPANYILSQHILAKIQGDHPDLH